MFILNSALNKANLGTPSPGLLTGFECFSFALQLIPNPIIVPGLLHDRIYTASLLALSPFSVEIPAGDIGLDCEGFAVCEEALSFVLKH